MDQVKSWIVSISGIAGGGDPAGVRGRGGRDFRRDGRRSRRDRPSAPIKSKYLLPQRGQAAMIPGTKGDRSMRLSRLLSLAGLALAASTPAAAGTRMLTDFTGATPDLGWIVVNDGVMGGRSQGGFVRAGDALDFTGTTNTNGGGFSSIRSREVRLDLGGYEGIRVRVRGDGRRYTWRLTTDARWRGRTIAYRADFETRKGEWTVADIPFSRFRPQWRGRMLSGPALDPSRIRGLGLMIYDRKDGPFALRLDSVEAYRTPFSLESVRWKNRVLILAAPTADDTRLGAQLLEVARTRAAFEERDLLLVVLAGSSGSRAGNRALTTDEAAAIRRAVDIDPGSFAVRLVGKDGGVKHAAGAPVPIGDVYARIDRMPMRRAEMRR
jgi:NADH dehydrogenase [ubiquinone] 1 alpha subcomplex assembly factor 1